MKRSWPIVKGILNVAEKTKPGAEIAKAQYFTETYNRELGEDTVFEELLSYNINLLREQEFIIANTKSVDSIGRLTWKGHDLLDEIRGIKARESANE